MKTERCHYFFRFGSKNSKFNHFYRSPKTKQDQGKLQFKVGDIVDLAIYYDNFNADALVEWQQRKLVDKTAKPKNAVLKKLSSNSLTSIWEFASAKKGSIFWIFDNDDLIAFESINEKIFDAKHLDEQKNTKKIKIVTAKARKFKCLKIINRLDAPDIFSTTDSSGFQGTVLPLTSDSKYANKNVAEALVSGQPIKISSHIDLLQYLSPIQLETFFFMFFYSAGYHVSGYRGASKRKVDLLIKRINSRLPKTIGCFQITDKIELQIKRTVGSDRDIVLNYLDSGIYFVTLSDVRNKWSIESDYLVDESKIESLLMSSKAESAILWAMESLNYKCFIFEPKKLKKAG